MAGLSSSSPGGMPDSRQARAVGAPEGRRNAISPPQARPAGCSAVWVKACRLGRSTPTGVFWISTRSASAAATAALCTHRNSAPASRRRYARPRGRYCHPARAALRRIHDAATRFSRRKTALLAPAGRQGQGDPCARHGRAVAEFVPELQQQTLAHGGSACSAACAAGPPRGQRLSSRPMRFELERDAGRSTCGKALGCRDRRRWPCAAGSHYGRSTLPRRASAVCSANSAACTRCRRGWSC